MYEFIIKNYKSINKQLDKNEKYPKTYLKLIRFADDFLIIHPSIKAIGLIKDLVSEFLSNIGLELNEEKTKIRSSMNTVKYNNETIDPGVDFLGMYFRLNKSKSSTVSLSNPPTKTDTKLHSIPSSKSIQTHINDLRVIIKESRGFSQHRLIARLTPVIQGWTAYYLHNHSKKAFSYGDAKLFFHLKKWVYRRHPHSQAYKILRKYFIRHKTRAWTFGYFHQSIFPIVLPFHTQRKIINYNKTDRIYSPFSMDSRITQQNLKLNKTGKKLFNRQNGVCKWCLHPLRPGDMLEIHHTLHKRHPKREWDIYINGSYIDIVMIYFMQITT